MSNVFISYSRKDGDFVGRLERALSAREKNVWLDIDDIAPGAQWRDEIHLGLQACDGVVFVMTPESLRSDECGKELDQAIELNKRIVPVLHREPNGAAVHEKLAGINWVKLRAEDDFDDGVEKLVEALDKDFDWVHEHTRLGVRATEWISHGRNRSYLLRGSDLSEAEKFLTRAAGKQPEPTAEQLAYVAASRAAARRFNQRLLGSVSVALLIAIALSIVAFIERSSAVASQKRAFSRQLAADAETQLGVDPELSILLASKAYDVNPTAESVDVLRQSLATSKIRMTVRPADGVSQAALTPDGRTLVTAGRQDGIVSLWRYPGGAPEGRLPVPAAGQLALNPRDGRTLLVDRRSGRARVFAGTKPELSMGDGITDATWGGGGSYIATGSIDGTVALWNGRTGRRIGAARKLSEPIVASSLGAGPHYLAAMTRSGTVLVFDLRARRVTTIRSGCSGGQGEVLLSPDETRLLTYGGSCAATLWSTATFRPVGNLSSYAQGITSAVFSRDGNALVLATEVAAVINPLNGAQQGQYLGHDGYVSSVTLVPANSPEEVATGGQDGTIRLWDAGNPTDTTAVLRADVSSVRSVSSGQGGRELVSVDADGSAARVWDGGTPYPLRTMGNPFVSATGALSPDGRLAVGDDASDAMSVFDVGSGRVLAPLAGSRGADSSMAGPTSTGFADGGRIVYLLAPGGLKLWRAVDGAQLPAPPSAGYAPKAIAAAASAPRLALLLSRRGGGAETEILDPIAQRSSVVARESAGHVAIDERGIRVALAEGRRVHLIELATGHARWLNVRGGSADIRLLAFSGDGRRLAVGGADFLDIFSVSDGKLVGSLPSPARTQLASLALSYTGTVVAGGYSDLRARLWTATGDKLLMMAKEPEQPDEAGAGVTTVQISRDGSFLLTSASGASDIEIWDIASGSRLYAFNGFFAGWSDSAQLVLTTGGPLQSWACDVCTGPSQLRRLASTRVTRGFTPGERAKFLTQ